MKKILLPILLLFSSFKFFNVFSINEGTENISSNSVFTFNPQTLIELLDEIKQLRESIDASYKDRISSLQKKVDEINKKKEDLNKEIQEKGDTVAKSVFQKKYEEIMMTESAIYEEQMKLENDVRQSIGEMSRQAKEIVDSTIEKYLIENSNQIVIANDYKSNSKFDITDKLAKIANDNFKKTKNIQKKNNRYKKKRK